MGFLSLSYDELEKLNLSAKRLRAGDQGKAAAQHRKWLEKEGKVKAVTVCFSDIEGRLHMLDYDKKWLLAHADGLTFDGSSIRGFTELGESDLRLEIDWPAFYRLPADVFGAGKTLVFAFVRNRDGSPYPADFRGMLAAMSSSGGRTVSAAMEVEGFLFDGPNAEQAYSGGFSPASSRGYYHSLPGDPLRQFIDRAAEVQRAMGFENEKDHPEVAPAQFELNWSHAEMSIAADQVQLYKLVCRQVAGLMGMTASFLPKPVAGVNGSGMHINLSVSDSGENLFHDPSSDSGLSEMAISFADGILARANDICLILNPSVNAYRRLDPNYEAPNQIRRSSIDRGSMIRVPLAGRTSARIEVRSVSPDANPYMLLYALVGCGMSGSKTPRAGGVLHADIHAAMDGFSADDLIGADEAAKYMALKRAAADRSPRELGARVKRDEIVFHHEVTNQSLWSEF